MATPNKVRSPGAGCSLEVRQRESRGFVSRGNLVEGLKVVREVERAAAHTEGTARCCDVGRWMECMKGRAPRRSL